MTVSPTEIPVDDDKVQRIPRRRWLSVDFDDYTVAYRVAVRPVFDGLRDLIGQLAGLLILAQARPRCDLADLPELVIAREQWRLAVDHFDKLRPPEGRAVDRERLRQAAAHIDAALAVIGRLQRVTSGGGIGDAAVRLAAAYRVLQSVCDHDLDLTMVDMSGACCTCGRIFES